MKKAQRNCLTATLLMGMMFLAAIFTLQGALLTSLISHYSVAESIQGFASSAASIGGVVALVSSFFPDRQAVQAPAAPSVGGNLHVGIAFCAASTFLCALCCRFAKLPADKKA